MKTNISQNERILRALRRRPRRWVGLPTLAAASGSLSPATRISNLRQEGHNIENKTETRKGIRRSFYRLLP